MFDIGGTLDPCSSWAQLVSSSEKNSKRGATLRNMGEISALRITQPKSNAVSWWQYLKKILRKKMAFSVLLGNIIDNLLRDAHPTRSKTQTAQRGATAPKNPEHFWLKVNRFLKQWLMQQLKTFQLQYRVNKKWPAERWRKCLVGSTLTRPVESHPKRRKDAKKRWIDEN